MALWNYEILMLFGDSRSNRRDTSKWELSNPRRNGDRVWNSSAMPNEKKKSLLCPFIRVHVVVRGRQSTWKCWTFTVVLYRYAFYVRVHPFYTVREGTCRCYDGRSSGILIPQDPVFAGVKKLENTFYFFKCQKVNSMHQLSVGQRILLTWRYP